MLCIAVFFRFFWVVFFVLFCFFPFKNDAYKVNITSKGRKSPKKKGNKLKMTILGSTCLCVFFFFFNSL